MRSPDINAFRLSELAVAMAATSQEPEWHPEGDVLTHTAMVFEEAVALSDCLPPVEKSAVLWAALLHDCGKPACTHVDEAGRIVSPGHSAAGARMAMAYMEDVGVPGAVRDMAYHLIMLHGFPPWTMSKRDAVEETAWISLHCPSRALYTLCMADARGRGGNMARMVDAVELWRLQAEELDCFDRPFKFPSDHSRFKFCRRRQASLMHTNLFVSADAPTLTVMVGLPAAGKDTWIAANAAGSTLVSLDDIRIAMGVKPTDNQGSVRQEAARMAKAALAAGKDAVVNSTALSRDIRDGWGAMASDYGAIFHIVYVDPCRASGGTVAECIRRNDGRPGEVPSSVIRGLLRRLEPPTLAECHRLTEA